LFIRFGLSGNPHELDEKKQNENPENQSWSWNRHRYFPFSRNPDDPVFMRSCQ
jgi:hypothetical protein